MTPIYINYTTVAERRQVQIMSFYKYSSIYKDERAAAGVNPAAVVFNRP